MLAYIVRRILQAVPVLIGTTFLIYFMVFAMPGNPLLALFGDKTPNAALLARLEEQYHLNEPFIVQYLYYLGGVVRGDFGISFSGQSVNDILARTFPVTLTLAMMAIVIEIVDQRERVEAFLPDLDEMVAEGLVTLEPVQVILYRVRDGASGQTH